MATAEGQAADAGSGNDAGRRSEPESVRRGVHLAPCRAALDAGGARVGVHLDAVHPRQVDDDTVLDGSETRAAVAASADRNGEVRRARELEGGRDVGDGSAAGDHRRALVDHRVVQRPGVVVARVTGQSYLPVQRVA